MWSILYSTPGNNKCISDEKWPEFDKDLIKEEKVTIAVQVNGKLRKTIELPKDTSKDIAESKAIEAIPSLDKNKIKDGVSQAKYERKAEMDKKRFKKQLKDFETLGYYKKNQRVEKTTTKDEDESEEEERKTKKKKRSSSSKKTTKRTRSKSRSKPKSKTQDMKRSKSRKKSAKK